jgi:hypothetical protein
MPNMTNNARSLDDIPVAYLMADDSWVWKDDMITFPADDGFYDDEDLEYEGSWYEDGAAERLLADLDAQMDHPICGEFPQDSIVAPRGIWND